MDKKSFVLGIVFLLCAFVWGYVDYVNQVDATIGFLNVPQGLTVGFLLLGFMKFFEARK